MATNYPGAIDTYTNPLSSEPMNAPSHAGQHANANDAVEAIETELGTDPSGSAATVKARLDGIEDGTRLGTNSVGAAQIANDSVDTAAIQSKAVTAAKIADDTITAAQIAANAVGSSELADNAVDTNAIQDGAVTPAKLATSGRFLFPAADGWGFTGGAVTLQGTAAPEGAVSAALGSTYLQTSGAATVTGMMSWRKTTGGTGATGWSPEGALADTGWRDVTSALLNSHTAAEFKIRRIGQTVHLRVSDATGTTAADIYTLATGWRTNSAGSRFYVQRINSGSVYAGRLYMADGGGTTVSLNTLAGTPAKAAGDTWNATLTWATNDGWPASLPGSATT